MVWIYPHLTHPMLNQRIGITARARVDTGSLPNAIFEETFVDIAIGIVGRRFSWRCQDHQETWRRNEEISCVFSIPENSGKTAKNLGLSWCSPFKLPCFLGGPLCSDNIMFFSNRKCYHWHLTQILLQIDGFVMICLWSMVFSRTKSSKNATWKHNCNYWNIV